MKPIQLAALFLSASISASVIAQPPEGGPGGFGGGRGFRMPNPLLAALDKDKDGVLSAEEIEHATAALKTLDKNNDGKLSHAELLEGFAATMGIIAAQIEVERIMQAADIDKNGHIDYSEFIAATTDKRKLLSKERLKAAF